MTMLAEYGTLSLADVLAPAIQMADGYPIEAQTREHHRAAARRGSSSGSTRPRSSCRTRARRARRRSAGEIFVQTDLAATLRKLVEAEQQALAAGKTRKEAIYAAYDRFYKGDIAQEIVRGVRRRAGCSRCEDLARLEGARSRSRCSTTTRASRSTSSPSWQQGPAMLQALNILENADLKAMGYNSPRYIHTLYQAMNLAFADRDFYYGDPVLPARGAGARAAVQGVREERATRRSTGTRNDPTVKPGDPYPFQGGTQPVRRAPRALDGGAGAGRAEAAAAGPRPRSARRAHDSALRRRRSTRGTTSIEAADDGGLGGVGHAERRLGAGGDRGPHRRSG